jgi:DNA-binding PadR family transcriptional regulator
MVTTAQARTLCWIYLAREEGKKYASSRIHYRTLSALVRDGLVTLHAVPYKKGTREEVRISPDGEIELEESLVSLIEVETSPNPPYVAGSWINDELIPLLEKGHWKNSGVDPDWVRFRVDRCNLLI